MFRKIILATVLLSSAFVSFAQKDKQVELYTTLPDGKKIFYNEVGAPLPPINIWRMDGKFLTNDSLANQASLIIMLFNPTCEHCEEMGKTFRKNITLFNKTNLVLVAPQGMSEYLDGFVKTIGSKNEEKIQIGIDSSGFVNQTFLYKSLPQINIYNKDRKLEKLFFGDVPIESLRKYIE